MATAWPTTDPVTAATLARTHYGADKGVSTGRVDALVDRDAVLRIAPFPIYFAEISGTQTTFTNFNTYRLWVPYSWSGLTVNVYFEARRSNTTNEMRVRLYDADGAAALGSELVVTGTTYAVVGPISFTIPAGWIGAVRSLQFQAKVAVNTTTWFARCITTYESYVTD